jgi:FkbM family methyltransferase
MAELKKSAFNVIVVDPDEVQKWTNSTDVRFSSAVFLARYMPRGKGWFPRFIGRKFCQNMKIAISTASGAELAVRSPHLDIYTSMILKGGTWEQRVLDACLNVIQPGDIFYDIGANAGYMSIEVANHFKNDVRVVAFEPQTSLAHSIAVSAHLNSFPNIDVYAIMLGSEEGTVELFIPTSSIHASSVSRAAEAECIQCPCTSLDRLVLEKIIPPPNVIKIDVEGGELDVFRGARQVISQYAPTIIFEADDNMERFDYTRKDIIEELTHSHDYSFYAIGKEAQVYIEMNSLNIEDMRYSELIALPNDRAIEECKIRR